MTLMTQIMATIRRLNAMTWLLLGMGVALQATSGATITQPASNVTVPVGQAVAFAGTSTCDAAADVDSASVVYTWAFGDNGTGSGSSTSHAYAASGTYTVTLSAYWTLNTYIDGLHPRTITTHSTYSATRTVIVQAPASIGSFTASTASVLQGGAVTLNWTTSNATSLSISGVGAVTGASTTVYPNATTTYILTASNAVSSVNASVTVNTQPVTVSLSPGSTSINLGGSVTFTGSASAANSNVTWSATGGSFSGATYTGSTSGTFTVTATSVADSTKSATATVNVATVAVATPVPNPVDGKCFVGGTVSLSAAVSGAANTAVVWSVNGGGTIDTSGVFTASSQGTWTVTATSVQDSTKKATATVQVVPLTVTISPGNVTVSGNQTQVFTASVASSSGTPNQAVTWSVVESNGGTIASNGTYTAPVASGNYTVKATSVQDPTCSGTIQVHVPGWALKLKKDILYVGAKEIAEIESTGKTWVTFVDHLGSPRLIWDGTSPAGNQPDGAHLVEQKFMPFGESLTDPAGASKFTKGFTSHEQTDASGLIYMQARFYAPWFGRFLSPDPARDQHFEETQSWNIYSYVQNDPTMRIDPTGMAMVDTAGLKKAVVNAATKVWNFLTGKKSPDPAGSPAKGGPAKSNPKAVTSDAQTKATFDGVAKSMNSTPVYTSGDRSAPAKGGAKKSDHMEHRAQDGHVKGKSDDATFQHVRDNPTLIPATGYQVIHHGPYTATDGEHIHVGRAPDGSPRYNRPSELKVEGMTPETTGVYTTVQTIKN